MTSLLHCTLNKKNMDGVACLVVSTPASLCMCGLHRLTCGLFCTHPNGGQLLEVVHWDLGDFIALCGTLTTVLKQQRLASGCTNSCTGSAARLVVQLHGAAATH
jgi:hypothetical protein